MLEKEIKELLSMFFDVEYSSSSQVDLEPLQVIYGRGDGEPVVTYDLNLLTQLLIERINHG